MRDRLWYASLPAKQVIGRKFAYVLRVTTAGLQGKVDRSDGMWAPYGTSSSLQACSFTLQVRYACFSPLAVHLPASLPLLPISRLPNLPQTSQPRGSAAVRSPPQPRNADHCSCSILSQTQTKIRQGTYYVHVLYGCLLRLLL